MLIIGLSLLIFELPFIWTVNRPSLVIGTPVIGLVVKLIGAYLPILRLFLLPLSFALSILCLLAILFLTRVLVFTLSLELSIAGRSGIEILGKLKVAILDILDDRGKCDNLFLLWGHGVPLVIFA